jgi:acyl-CoA dehydrogenase
MRQDDTSEMLSDAVQRALSANSSPQQTVKCEALGIDHTAWRCLTDLGLTTQESTQLGFREFASVLRTIGYFGALVPYAESECLGRWIANAAGFETQPNEVLSILIVDRERVDFDRSHSRGFASLARQRVKWGTHANRVLLVFSDRNEHFATVLPASDFGFESETNLAGEPYGVCTVSSIRMSVVRAIDAAVGGQMRSRAAFCRVSEMYGAVRRVNELTLGYASDRKQFGRPIAQYQVIQSYLAEMAAEAGAAAAILDVATDVMNDDPAGDCAELAAARVRMNRAAQLVCRHSHQIHGAIGFTRECPLQLWTRRLWAWREEYGNEIEWARRLGELVIGLGPFSYWERITR